MEQQIDENLYSRQLYAIGFDAMKSLTSAKILICGIDGLGVECAKNIILQGCKQVTLHDTYTIKYYDIGTNYYISDNDIGLFRAEISHKKLSELNPYVEVVYNIEPLCESLIEAHDVVILINYNLATQIKINKITRAKSIKYINCSSRGLIGQVFCDFGDNFVVKDQDGEQPSVSIIETISCGEKTNISCLETNPHNLTNGDYVSINKSDPIEIEYVNKCSFNIVYNGSLNIGDEIVQLKMPKTMNFISLDKSIENPEIMQTDFVDFGKPLKLHKIWLKLSTTTFESFDEFIKCFTAEEITEISNDLIRKVFSCWTGYLVPVNSIIGGIVAQEVMKSISHKFTPICQWLYYDALDCLIDDNVCDKENGSRYDSQTMVFGGNFQKKLGDLNYFVVGAGAIGCELLKNFAMIGVAAGKGSIIVTDMDTIEKSNLNRQFLFRNSDIGKSKSSCAANSIKSMNPNVNIIAHLNRVGPETETVYNSTFFNSLDGVANALDNVSARMYMDSRCVTFKKSLLESGTLGTKGNVQVIVPHVTESYASSRDPPEASIPVCTIKSFPNALEHCIQYSREQFEDFFTTAPKNAVDYIQNKVDPKNLPPGDALTFIGTINFVLSNVPKSIDDCIRFSYMEWHKYYCFQIMQLLVKFPSDATTSSGIPFWSSGKKCPTVLSFDLDNSMHIDYIISYSNLWATIFNIPHCTDIDYFRKILSGYTPPSPTIDETVHISATDEEEKKHKELEESNVKLINIAELIDGLPLPDEFKNQDIIPQIFEKDNDKNFHIDFITSSANMRALNYGIANGNKHVVKGIAGKIIPALATTTSVIAGIATLELYKLVSGCKNISIYKNTFINLALPYFGFSEPISAKRTVVNGKTFTMWDSIVVKGDMTLQNFIELIKTQHGLDIDTIMYGNFTLYGLMIPQRMLKQRFDITLRTIIENETKTQITADHIILQICMCTDDENDETELPEVIYFF